MYRAASANPPNISELLESYRRLTDTLKTAISCGKLPAVLEETREKCSAVGDQILIREHIFVEESTIC